MRFKKVEIQAFRAYDKVEDSTFNFELPDGSSADFISLYAPNGFGKTSFYDAVEFGITKNIHRFLKRHTINKDTAKSERSISTKTKQYILRNKFSEEDTSSFIKLYTSDSVIPIVTDIAKPGKVGGFDYKFDMKHTINEEFQSVILSQEWIDAFLKEDTATDRFDTFIEHFGDKQLDEYYRKLTDLILYNKKRIDGVKKEIALLQSELDFKGDLEILTKVNKKIGELISKGEKVTRIEFSFTAKDELNLLNKLSERNSDLLFELKRISSNNGFIDGVHSGNSKMVSLASYLDSRIKLASLLAREKDLDEMMDKLKKRKANNNKMLFFADANKNKSQDKSFIESLIDEYDVYAKLNKEINQKNTEIKKLNTISTNIEKNISETKKALEEAKIKITSQNKQIRALENTLQSLPKIITQINIANEQLINLEKELANINELIDDNKRENTTLNAEQNIFAKAIRDIASGNYSLSFNKMIQTFEELGTETKELENQLVDEKKNKISIDKKFKSHQKFQLDIEKFISKGAEIVNQNQFSSCPLCSFEYRSFEELSAKVSDNKLISSILSDLIKERNTNDKLIKKLIKSIRRNRRALTGLVKRELRLTENKFKASSKKIFALNTRKDTVLYEIKLLTNKLKTLDKEIGGQTTTFSLPGKLEILKNESPKLSANLEELEHRHNNYTTELKINQSNTSEINSEITKLRKNTSYNKIIKHFRIAFPDKAVSITLIQNQLKEILKEIDSNINEMRKCEKELNGLNKFLLEANEKDLSAELQALRKIKLGLTQITTSFELATHENLNLQPKDLTDKEIHKTLNNLKSANQKKVSDIELLMKEYQLLSELLKNVAPYLKYEKAKQEQNKMSEHLHFLTETISKDLNDEKNKVSAYINSQINSFFHEDLINDLYKSIDPHPDYKNIKFVTDFSEDKPKLNICVYQTNEEELIIPNLYFSTAQLNILSLSIFLAKALNAKDDKGVPFECIFIDDPIQSMDSINILSTIDLLRSIVINQKKQIILSTHDENFHALLKKKMPPGLFNSKFIELETFGKVKQEAV